MSAWDDPLASPFENSWQETGQLWSTNPTELWSFTTAERWSDDALISWEEIYEVNISFVAPAWTDTVQDSDGVGNPASLTDANTFGDSAVSSASGDPAITDGPTVADTAVAANTAETSFSDTITVADTIVQEGIGNLSITEARTFGDTKVSDSSTQNSISDLVTLAATEVGDSLVDRSFTEAITVTDALIITALADLQSISDFLWSEPTQTWQTDPDETWPPGEPNQIDPLDFIASDIDLGAIADDNAIMLDAELSAEDLTLDIGVAVVEELFVGATAVPECDVDLQSVFDFLWVEPTQTWETDPTEDWFPGEPNQVNLLDFVEGQQSLEFFAGGVSDLIWTEATQTWEDFPIEDWDDFGSNPLYLQDFLDEALGAQLFETLPEPVEVLDEIELEPLNLDIIVVTPVTLKAVVVPQSALSFEFDESIELFSFVRLFADIWRPGGPFDSVWTPDGESDSEWGKTLEVDTPWKAGASHSSVFGKQPPVLAQWGKRPGVSTNWTPETGKDDEWSKG